MKQAIGIGIGVLTSYWLFKKLNGNGSDAPRSSDRSKKGQDNQNELPEK